MSLFNSIIPFKKGSRPRVPCPLVPIFFKPMHCFCIGFYYLCSIKSYNVWQRTF